MKRCRNSCFSERWVVYSLEQVDRAKLHSLNCFSVTKIHLTGTKEKTIQANHSIDYIRWFNNYRELFKSFKLSIDHLVCDTMALGIFFFVLNTNTQSR